MCIKSNYQISKCTKEVVEFRLTHFNNIHSKSTCIKVGKKYQITQQIPLWKCIKSNYQISNKRKEYIAQESLTNDVDKILDFLTTNPLRWNFLWYGHFLTMHQPRLVNVVCGRPLSQKIKKIFWNLVTLFCVQFLCLLLF